MKDWGANRGEMDNNCYEKQALKLKKWYIQLFRERFYFVGVGCVPVWVPLF